MKIKNHSLAMALCLGLTATAAVIGITGCAGDRYNRSTGEFIDDQTLQGRVHHVLGSDPAYKYNDVTVTAFKGTVQLGGFVFLTEQQTRAGELAREVTGVREVVNNIIVRDRNDSQWDNGRRTPDQDRRTGDYSRPPGEYVDDKTLTARVKSALHSNGMVKLDDVIVSTYNGTVQLGGFVNTADQKARASEVVRQVPGVKDVANSITVK